MKFREGNAGKIIYNKHCGANKHLELNAEMDGVDTTLKENPN